MKVRWQGICNGETEFTRISDSYTSVSHIPMLNFCNSEAKLLQGTWMKTFFSLMCFWEDQLGSYLTVFPSSVNLTWTVLATTKSLGSLSRKSPWRTSIQFMWNRLVGTSYWKLSLSTLWETDCLPKFCLLKQGQRLLLELL